MARWRDHFSLLLNVHTVNDVRQTETNTAEPLVPETSAFEVELAVEKLRSHISPGIDQIPAELMKAGGRTICCEIHKLINSIRNKWELPEEWKELSLYLSIRRALKQTVYNYSGISYMPTMYKILSNILLSRITPYAEETTGIISVDFDARSQLLIIYFVFVKYLKKKWEYSEAVHQLFIDFKIAYHSVRREVLYRHETGKAN